MNSEGRVQRRSAKQKAEIALAAIKGAPPHTLSSQHKITDIEIKSWVETFLDGGRNAFRKHVKATGELEMTRLHAKIGELVMENQTLRESNGASSTSSQELDED